MGIQRLIPAFRSRFTHEQLELRQRTLISLQELWIIDPEKLTIAVDDFTARSDAPGQIHGAGAAFSSRHFPDLQFEARAIFAR